ncbi:hypothetical protein DPMN_053923 [Dreissena polymorpha]|uniref:Gonadal protein gdl n=1 Tax=Dreissena polymorpha TaxID=45954 RepID=A0A9D4HPA1_DREPO|nr:hypothetical protein DPMN_053923 [Dreissena polymorpha]
MIREWPNTFLLEFKTQPSSSARNMNGESSNRRDTITSSTSCRIWPGNCLSQKHELQKKHKAMLLDCQTRPHNLTLTKSQIDREIETTYKRCEEEIRKKDQKIIMELDQKVMDQQSTLEKAGVPGFYVTNKPLDIRMQMYLLDFIVRLSKLEIPS